MLASGSGALGRAKWICGAVGLILALAAAVLTSAPAGAVAPNLDAPEASDVPSVASDEQGDLVPGRYIVVFEDSVKAPANLAEAQTEARGRELGFVYRYGLKGYSAELPKGAVEALRENPKVKFVEPDRQVEALAQSTPDGIKRIGAAQNPALDIDEVDDARVDVDVAIIDTGIDHTHPDLDVVSRTNCIASEAGNCVDSAGTDGNGHGTHVAGTAAAIDNGFGVVGVAPGARLRAVRVLDDLGSGYNSWTLAGINWVTEHANEIEVANMSLGGAGRSPATDAAIKASVEAGVVYVVAAGNAGASAESASPANTPDAITVSAMVDTDGKAGGEGSSCAGKDDTLATGSGWGSNWGSGVELVAPGTCVYSTMPVKGSFLGGSNYGSLNGTSMAAPHVAGAAAVLAAETNPKNKADVEMIREQLIDAGSLDWNDTSGDGEPEPLLYMGTTPLGPEAATGGWQGTDVGKATLTGSLNPRGLEAEYEFEYGLTTSYGATAPATLRSQEGNFMAVEGEVEGLELGRTHHYRLVVTTPQGTIYGADRTLKPSLWQLRSQANAPSSEWEGVNSVSCPTNGWCMAVQLNHQIQGDEHLGSYELKNGQWTYRAMPTPAGGELPATPSVSCTSSSNCIAVGRARNEGDTVPLAFKWNGTSWSTQSVPVPPTEASSPYARLDDVSCATASECMAVGFFRPKNGVDPWRAYAAQLKAGTWTNMFPLPESFGYLFGVSCLGSGFCAATGAGETLTWDGSSWAAHEPALSGTFQEVSCTSSSFCLAVSGEKRAQVWNGAQWSAVPGVSTSLRGVDCISPDDCVAVGHSDQGAKKLLPIVESWDGSSFSPQDSLREHDRSGYFWDVDCVSVFSCAAVGASEGETRKPLIATTPNWRPVAEADPASDVHINDADLSGVINPSGVATSYEFEWGTTTAYGKSAPVPMEDIGSGTEPVEVSQAIDGLLSETKYHFRLVAKSGGGIANSMDRTFTTPSDVTTLPVAKTGFEATEPKAWLVGETDPGDPHLMGFNGATYGCLGDLSSQAALSMPREELTLDPQWSSCTSASPLQANGCKLSFESGSETSPNHYSGTFSVGPPGCGPMKMTLNQHCRVSVPAQSGKPVTLQNTGSGSSAKTIADLNVGNLTYTRENLGGCGTTKEFSDGSYVGAWEVSGLNDGGGSVGINATDRLRSGLFLSGKASENPQQKPRFGAETYPTPIRGKEGVAHTLTAPLSISCDETLFGGGIPGPTASLPFAVSNAACSYGSTSVTVYMNSCGYELDVLNSGPPYVGEMSVVCDTEGDAIETKVDGPFGACLAKISPQDGLQGVTFQNQGSGSKRSIEVDLDVKGIEYTTTGGFFQCLRNQGTYSDGTYTGTMELQGLVG